VLRRLLPVVLVALAFAAPAQAFSKQDLTIRMLDGVDIAATLYLPDGAPPAAGWPAVMLFHGNGESRTSLNAVGISMNDTAERFLAPFGYAVLTHDLRGHGASGGLYTLNGPRAVQDTRELYEWLHENRDVAFLPVDLVNSPEAIGRNRRCVTINAALAVDIHGQVVADTIGGAQHSGIGGHEDFVAGPALDLEDRSLLCLPSTVSIAGELRSRIVPWFEAGTVVTTPRHQVDVIVTEYGAAELEGLTVHQRGLALAEIAHPDFREELAEAAARASKGRSPVRR